ncbi:MAG: NAD(P)-dependent alcohol dehydrogenase [Candidatus Nanopelagicaceae bacterium]|nr:NAD(P)-dependent alcohol dehydrogenase [Candidatus Nanopelagicaceae bacterium]
MKALRLMKWKSEAEIVELPKPTPAPGQLVIKIGGAGACHLDLDLMKDFGDGQLSPLPAMAWKPPFTLGHENAGWIDLIGAGVSRFREGDPVAVYGSWGCGKCGKCKAGFETYCDNPAKAPVPGGGGGLGLDGGMAEYMLVPFERLLLDLPDGLKPIDAAPLTDAALTPYHAIKRSWAKLTPDAFIVIIGVGGLGHMAVQIAKVTTGATIIAIDSRNEALELATSLGANYTFKVGDEIKSKVKDLTSGHGAEVVLDFVGNKQTMALGASICRTLGDFTIVGIAGEVLPFSFFSVPYKTSLQTTYWGSRVELAEVLDLAAHHLISSKISKFKLADAPQVYLDLAAGKIEGRAVIVP